MRTSALTLFLAVALISLGACRKPAGTQPAANSNDAAVHEAPVGGKAMSGARPCAQQGHAGDGEQRPLVPRSRCSPRLMPSVRLQRGRS